MGDDFTHTFDATETGRYSVEVTRSAPRGDRIEVFSSPVWFESGAAFELGKLKRNKKNGTAKLQVNGLRGPGELKLTGKGLKTKKIAAGPGSATLKLKPKGKAKKKLRKKGKAKVKAAVAFAPQGGEAAQLSKKLKLKRKRHKHGPR